MVTAAQSENWLHFIQLWNPGKGYFVRKLTDLMAIVNATDNNSH
jgi:hypothetical protein